VLFGRCLRGFFFAHKNGEVVDPAGGETGGPRSLAEDYKKLSFILFLMTPFSPLNVPAGLIK
jgi:hypothetical protein